jgi:hypothetical protein
VKRARELIYTAERQASRDVGLAGLRLKPGSSHMLFFLLKKENRILETWRFILGFLIYILCLSK